METTLIFSFLGASILLTIMPGPDNIYVLTESLTRGARNGIAVSMGLVTGVMIHTLAATTGLSLFIQNSAISFSIIKYLGAGYLFYIAYQAIQEKQIFIDKIQTNSTNNSFFGLAQTGFFMNVLNPKVSLFFIAFLPQFISKNGIHVALQMIILGFIFMVQALIIFAMISILSGRLSVYLNNAKFWKMTKWTKVIVLSVLGFTLAFSEK